MLHDRLYLATIAAGADETASRFGLGLEIDEFCTAANFDADFDRWDGAARAHLAHSDRFVFHAPFAELCPCAIDPMVRDVTMRRFRQAAALSRAYGIRRIVVHSGFIPHVYYPVWFVEQSARFFRALLDAEPEVAICVENVLDDDPAPLMDLADAVDDPRLGLCLDVGHANTSVSRTPPMEWIGPMAPWLKHVHLHNNRGDWDLHDPLGQGDIPMAQVLDTLLDVCPAATYTIENQDCAPSLTWLAEQGYLEERA